MKLERGMIYRSMDDKTPGLLIFKEEKEDGTFSFEWFERQSNYPGFFNTDSLEHSKLFYTGERLFQ